MMPVRPTRALAVAALLSLLPLAACATADPGRERAREPVRDSRFITAEEIAESGARNAWEAIRGCAGLSLTEDGRGNPRSVSKRGRSSIHLDDTPVVVVDGMRVMDFAILRSIDARTIASIEVTNGIQGTLRYGTGSGGGAIVVTTRKR